jgi:hypothetical protein
MNATISRRNFLLKGALGGTAVTLGIPLLDRFLDGNGTAFAASLGGGRLPVRFGTWFWGCGMIPERWVPQKVGTGYDLPPQLMPIKAVQDRVSVLTGFDVLLDGKPNLPHISGNTAVRTGEAADTWQGITGPTFDVLISDAIGSGSYFRALDLSLDGNPQTSYSFRNGSSVNAAVPSPIELYQKIFGPDFHDPNTADFKPDPKYMVRQSVLSGVSEQRSELLKRVGAEDRRRLDQYFTSVREMEGKLALQLQKPPSAEACMRPEAPVGIKGDITDLGVRKANHKLMTQLLGMALACNQTRAFNMNFDTAAAELRRAGDTTGYHQSTHEELVDRTLGYQPTVDKFATGSMEAWADFVETLSAIREGDGTLLDNMLVVAHSEVSFAKNHDVTGIPVMLAGRAGGKVKQGQHINGAGEPISRIGLTAQQVMGVPVDSWGRGAMRSNRPVADILV